MRQSAGKIWCGPCRSGMRLIPMPDSSAQFCLRSARHPVPQGEGSDGVPLMKMRIGKSITSIVITGAFAHAGYTRCVLVVIPLSILGA